MFCGLPRYPAEIRALAWHEADGQRKDEPDWLGEGVSEVRYVLRFE